MGRPSHSRSLSIWANGIRVGRWTLLPHGEMQLQYEDAWVNADIGRPLSLSLPFNLANRPLKGPAVLHYFDNLLPDSLAIRKRVAERFRTGSTEAFDLLQAIGRDCVGAVQLLGADEAPTAWGQVQGIPLFEDDIERHLRETVSPRSLADAQMPHEDFRISLAGAQEKTALLRWKGQWMKPVGATPSTHILKLPMGLVGGQQADFTTSVDNEWLCMRLLRAYGLEVAEASMARFGAQRVLVVERFDRRLSPDGQTLLRLPQEDFCQVAGVSPWRKYESEGGPGLKMLFDTLRQSVRAEADMRTLMAAQILFWMMRAPDGHAKNFSIQLLPRGRFQLTPLYDVMSAYPVLGEGPRQWSPRHVRLAMALLGRNRHYLMRDIQRRHFNSTVRQLGLGDNAEPLIEDILASTPTALAEVRNTLPSDVDPHVADAVLQGMQEAAHALEAMPAT
ncbi:MAG: type II toxin-antitoxin system HipA family toxin [Aquabacterium sp.]